MREVTGEQGIKAIAKAGKKLRGKQQLGTAANRAPAGTRGPVRVWRRARRWLPAVCRARFFPTVRWRPLSWLAPSQAHTGDPGP
jgi:hypothetical protein